MRARSRSVARWVAGLALLLTLLGATSIAAAAQSQYPVPQEDEVWTTVNINAYQCPSGYDQISDCGKLANVVVSVIAGVFEAGPVTTKLEGSADAIVATGASVLLAVSGGVPAGLELEPVTLAFQAVEGINPVTLIFVPAQVDAQAGTLSVRAYQTPSDNPRTEFRVSSEEHAPAGDGFAQAGLALVLTDAAGAFEDVNTSADTGLVTLPLQTGAYSLTEPISGAAINFSVDAEVTTYVTAAHFFAQDIVDQEGTLRVTSHACSGLNETLIEVNAPGTGTNPNLPAGCQFAATLFNLTLFSETPVDSGFAVEASGVASIALAATHSVPHLLTDCRGNVTAPFTISPGSTTEVVVSNPVGQECDQAAVTALPSTGSGASMGPATPHSPVSFLLTALVGIASVITLAFGTIYRREA